MLKAQVSKAQVSKARRIDIDESIIRTIARQAEAERTRRAKIINAEVSSKRRRSCSMPPAPGAGAAGDAAALSRYAVRHCRRAELYHRVSAPDRPHPGLGWAGTRREILMRFADFCSARNG
jgi:hypothetical protein